MQFTASKDITSLCTQRWFLPPQNFSHQALLQRRNASQLCRVAFPALKSHPERVDISSQFAKKGNDEGLSNPPAGGRVVLHAGTVECCNGNLDAFKIRIKLIIYAPKKCDIRVKSKGFCCNGWSFLSCIPTGSFGLCLLMDARHPHSSAGTSSRLAAFRPEETVSFIQLLPCYLSSPSTPVPFFSLEILRSDTSERTVITASTPCVR